MYTYHNISRYYLIRRGSLALVELRHVGVLVNANQCLLAAVSHNLRVREGHRRIAKVFSNLVLNVLVFLELHLLLGLLRQRGLYSKQMR